MMCGIGMAAFPTRDFVCLVMPVVDVEIRQCAEGFEKSDLSSLFIRRVFHFRREILGRGQRLIRLQKMQADLLDVQPIEAPPAFGAQAKVEIKAVNVSDDTFHNTAFAHKRDSPPCGGRRAGDAISGGVAHIISDF